MPVRPFRFGANMAICDSRAKWQDKARRAESFGYDVLMVPDHLGMPAPFPALVSAAEVTAARLGTYVLNAGLHRPAFLAREVATTDLLVDGRLELGLGTGFAKEEFEAAGLGLPGGGERVDHLTHIVTEVRSLLAADHRPPAAQRPAPPILIGGRGPRLLRFAAEHADIVGIANALPLDDNDIGHAALAKQMELVRSVTGTREAEPELNFLVLGVHPDASTADVSFLRHVAPGLPDERIRMLPGMLAGSPSAIADTLREYRDTYGLTYFTVDELSMDRFAEVIAKLR